MGTRRMLAGLAIAVGLVAAAHAQTVVRTGPPPELRKHMDALVKAFNSASDEEWATMVKENFTPEFNKQHSADALKKLHADLKAKFGTIQIQNVERNGGPDAPIQVNIKGTVASGSLWMDIDDGSFFDSIKGEVQKTLNADRRH